MKVVVDWGVYYDKKGGAYRYMGEILSRMKRHNVDVEILGIREGTATPQGEGIETKRHIVPTATWFPNGRLKRSLSKVKQGIEGIYSQWRISRDPQTVFHSAFYNLPTDPNVPVIATIYDMITEKFEKDFPSSGFEEKRKKKLECVRRCTRLISISETTKNDLVECFDVDPDIVDVIPLAVDTAFFRESSSETEVQKLSRSFDLARPFILHVSGREDHKNFRRLFEAYCESTLKDRFALVSVGAPWSQREREDIEKYSVSDRVHVFCDLTESELRAVYQHAQMLAYPSIYEGFGLPLLEAMAAGVPVVAANSGPIPEVTGDAAILVDPYDTRAIEKGLVEMSQAATAEKYIELGKHRVELFSWDRCAEETVRSYERCLKSLKFRKSA